MRSITGIICLGMITMISTPAFAADKVVATVNKAKITELDVQQFSKMMKMKNPKFDETNPRARTAIINNLVNMEVLFQEAKKNKLDKNPDVAFVLRQQEMELLSNALVQKQIGGKSIPEKQLKQLYSDQVAGANLKEYKARHILVKSEDEAKAVIAELDAGKDFAQLAKDKSLDSSAKAGGELGWFKPGGMVPEFSRAAAELQKGSYTKKPVQTVHGWHVIKLDDSKDLEPPTFEQVRGQLESFERQKMLQAYIKKLRDKAKIDIK